MGINKFITFGLVTVSMLGASTVNNVIPDTTAQAATHHIRYYGKTYKSKYTVAQMRKKYHLKFKHKGFAVFNRFFGIASGIHTGRWSSGKWHGGKKYSGNYAMFKSSPGGEDGMVHTFHYVNLKTGKLHMSTSW